MTTVDQNKAECLIFTFKEGLLSAVAHDLKLRVEAFTIDIGSDKSIRAKFDPNSVKCLCSIKDGVESPGTLSDRDLKQIHDYMDKDILQPAKYAEVLFVSTSVKPEAEGYLITGKLTLHGKENPITVQAKKAGDRLVAELSFNQSDFGIKPFSAVFGTLKIKPEIRVRVSVPHQ